ncbi:hypothetical protein CTA2_4885 [Colletotrichum tanaceti]|uniref:Uncharacterized protein n=1 Tax=Colletotrichum tanaceti TaxID=1306861 RepID=A0A4U6XTD6_9PEZI|nr:hypothetical protein CTA2_4885 [Colletotrichum tanaceti]TKW59207.1 hypothetical protein CTA1_1941 [Colletotrichum tanaceti]
MDRQLKHLSVDRRRQPLAELLKAAQVLGGAECGGLSVLCTVPTYLDTYVCTRGTVCTLHFRKRKTLTPRASDADLGRSGDAGPLGMNGTFHVSTGFSFLENITPSTDLTYLFHIQKKNTTSIKTGRHAGYSDGEPRNVDDPTRLPPRLPDPPHRRSRGSLRQRQRRRGVANGRVPTRLVRPAPPGASIQTREQGLGYRGQAVGFERHRIGIRLRHVERVLASRSHQLALEVDGRESEQGLLQIQSWRRDLMLGP